MSDTPGKRLKAFRESLDLNQREFAAALGKAPGTIGNIESDYRKISGQFLRSVSDHFDLNTDWLLTGHGEMIVQRKGFAARTGTDRITPVPSGKPGGDFAVGDVEMVTLDVYAAMPSAGPGMALPGDDIVDRVTYSTGYMRQLGITKAFACFVTIRGDSMEPVLYDGDRALLDLTAGVTMREGVHVFRYHDDLFAKLLIPQARNDDGVVTDYLVRSYHEDHDDWRVAGEDVADMQVIGRIVSRTAHFDL